MQTRLRLSLATLLLALAGTVCAQSAQTAPALPSFDVATVKPSPPFDPDKMRAMMQAGKMPKFGPHIDASQAEYTYMSLKDLVAAAYAVKAYQVTGPDWLAMERFDIVARIPEGASKDDVPAMLQALLKDRFKLAARRDTAEHPALALVVGKGGPKLKEVPAPAEVLDDDAPLKPGEMKLDTPDGPARITRNPDGSSSVNMGARGTFVQRMTGQSLRLEASSITMPGFAEMLNSMMQAGGGAARQVVDMTGLKGHYQVAIEVSFADLMANARAMGMGGPGGPQGAGADATGPLSASDPSGNSTIFASVQALGLKLDPRKAMVEQIVVDHAEKTPTDN